MSVVFIFALKEIPIRWVKKFLNMLLRVKGFYSLNELRGQKNFKRMFNLGKSVGLRGSVIIQFTGDKQLKSYHVKKTKSKIK